MSAPDATVPGTPVVPLQMLGAPDAAVCEDDTCLLPGAALPAPRPPDVVGEV
ncbi:MAG: hypothetical protein ABI807_11430 [Sporichthyaceae bacterium]